MNKILDFVLILFLSTIPLFADNSFEEIHKKSDEITSTQKNGNSPIIASIGTNLSSFLGEEGGWKPGYNFGFTFNIHIYKNLSMVIPFSHTRIIASPKNVEGRTPGFEEIVYKTFSNWKVSILFNEMQFSLSYKFLTQRSYDFSYILGFGIAFAMKDFSVLEKYIETDEIVAILSVAPVEPSRNELQSTANLTTGVRFRVGRYYLDWLYTFYPNDIKDIATLNSISLKFGIGVPM